jgi:hypothetical protein
MFQNLSNLSDDSWKYNNLYNIIQPNIKSESNIGIVSNPQKFSDISNNVALYQQYSDALFSNTSNALNTKSSDNSPLGNRYFYDTETQCNYKDSKVNKSIAVDGMGFSVTDLSNVGLVYSAQGNLKMIQPEIIPDSIPHQSDPNDSTCVSVNLQKSNAANDVGTNYISVKDYQRLNYSAFPNNCKKTTDADPSLPCADEGFGGHGENGGSHGGEHSRGSGHGDSVVVGHGGHYNRHTNWIGGGGGGGYNGYYDFMPTYLWTYPWYYNHGVIVEDDEKEDLERSTNIYLQPDLISGFFLGSITVLGLYIVFRMIKKSRE